MIKLKCRNKLQAGLDFFSLSNSAKRKLQVESDSERAHTPKREIQEKSQSGQL